MAANILKDADTLNDTGNALKLGRPVKDHTLQVTCPASVTALTIEVHGSLDGASWFTIDSHALSAPEITAEAALYHITDEIVEYVRAKVAALTGTGTINVLHSGK